MTIPLHPVNNCERYEPVIGQGGEAVCFSCGGRVATLAEKEKETAGKSDILTPELERFIRSLIGQHQKVILKHRQMIDDIKREFGLKE